jgi:hypothetical protein
MQQLATLDRTLRKPTSATAPPVRSTAELSTSAARHGVTSLGTSYQPRTAPVVRPPAAEAPNAVALVRATEPMSGSGTENAGAAPTADVTTLAPEPVDVVPDVQVGLDTVPTAEQIPAPEALEPVPEEGIVIEEPPDVQPVEAAEEGLEPGEPEVAEEEAVLLEDTEVETVAESPRDALFAAETASDLIPAPAPPPEAETTPQPVTRPGEVEHEQEGTREPVLGVEPSPSVPEEELEAEEEELDQEAPAEVPDERAAWAEVGEMAAGADEEGGPTDTGMAPELERWQTESRAAVQRVPTPPMGSAETRAAPLSRAGTKSATTYRGKAQKVTQEGKKVLPKSKEVKELPEFSGADPAGVMPILEAKSKLRFAKVKLPDLVKSPQGFQPRIGKPPLPPPPPKAESDLEKAGGTQAGVKTAPQLDALNTELAKGPKNLDQSLPGAGLEIVDQGPPPTPEVPAALKADMGKVIAHLMANTGKHAEAFMKAARTAAYPSGALDEQYPDMGHNRIGEEKGFLDAELKRVADAAGITEAQLNEHIAALHREVAGKQQEASKQLDAAHQKQKAELKDAGQGLQDTVRGVAQALKDHIEEKRAMSQGAAGKVVRGQRDRMLQEVTDHVAKKLVQYKNQGKVYKARFAAALQAYKLAYLSAVKADRDKLLQAAGADASVQAAAAATAKQSETWAKNQIGALTKQLLPEIEKIDAQVKSFQEQISQAGQAAKTQIRQWADAKLGVKRSWWEQLLDWILDWVSQAEADTKAWEQARAQETSQALAADLQILHQIRKVAGDELNADMKKAIKGLGEEQRAVIETYYGKGPQAKNPIAAVAAGMRVRLMKQRQPVLIKAFHAEVLNKPLTDHKQLKALAIAEVPGLNTYKLEVRADDLWKAFKGWGTTESLVYKALGGLTPLGGRALEAVYLARHGQRLKWRLGDEMSGAELDRANMLRQGKQIEAEAAQLRDAVEGIGTDEASIMQVLRNKTPQEREALKAAYKRMYHEDLDKRLSSEMSGHDLQRKDALMQGNVALADAIALDQAMRGGLFGLGTDEKGIEKVYEQNRKELEARATREGWTTERLNREIKKRNATIEQAYNTRYGKEYQGKGSYLRTQFKRELSGGELDLAVALADNDIVGIDAARLRIEKEGVYADDDVINSVLQKQHERAYEDKLRDLNAQLRQEEQEHFRKTGRHWTPEERQKRQVENQKKARAWAREQGGKQNMQALRKAYNAKSRLPWDTLDTLVSRHTSGVSGEKARTLLKQQGYLEPYQEIEFAIKGAGTDEEKLKATLKDKTKEEIDEIARKWEAEHPGQSFKERVLGELSGRDAFDVGITLKYGGKVTDPKKRLEMMRERVGYERSGLGTVIASHERALMEKDLAGLESIHARMQKLDASDPEYRKLKAQFDYQVDVSESSINLHRYAVDQITDIGATIAGVVATVAAVVVGAIIIAATGGAAAPGVIPALTAALSSVWVAGAGAAAATAATMATKYTLKGQAYGAEEMWTDLAVGGVDAIASFATAGVGGKLVKAGFLGKMATKGRGARMLAHGLAEASEGFLGTLPAAATGNVLNDKNWEQGNPVTNILLGTAFETGIGTMLSGSLGALGGIGKPPRPRPKSSSFDLLQFRGTPAERLKLWKAYKAENPGRTMKEFLRDLDEAILAQQQTATRQAALQRQLRGELLQHVPPAERRRFAAVPIEMMSEDDFWKLTRSRKGEAVVMFRHGKPTVVVKAGGDISSLGEEGLHLLQSVDPKLRKLVRQLDEKKLARWDNLSVAEQLDLYRTKVVLEIDAQERLIRSTSRQLADADLDPVSRQSLQRQLDRAHASKSSLQARLREVDGFSAADRMKMQRGELRRPQYLEQKPRLFSKTEDEKRRLQELTDELRGSEGGDEVVDAIAGVLPSLAEKYDANQIRRFIEKYGSLDTLTKLASGLDDRGFIMLSQLGTSRLEKLSTEFTGPELVGLIQGLKGKNLGQLADLYSASQIRQLVTDLGLEELKDQAPTLIRAAKPAPRKPGSVQLGIDEEAAKRAGLSNAYARDLETLHNSRHLLSMEEENLLMETIEELQKGNESLDNLKRLRNSRAFLEVPEQPDIGNPSRTHTLDTPSLTGDSVVLDSNLLVAPRKVARGEDSPGDRLASDYFTNNLMGKDLRVTDIQAGSELLPDDLSGVKGVSITTSRDSEEYQRLLTVLQRYRVGENKGVIDREILADLFFAQHAGGLPTFYTADAHITRPLAQIAGVPMESTTFTVKINGREIKVVLIELTPSES